jgi:hypothetical protein
VTPSSSTLLSGSFLIAFDDERAALDAARECRSVAFVATVTEEKPEWILSVSRKNLFPADERDRYESRLKRIVEPFGGRYQRFVPS